MTNDLETRLVDAREAIPELDIDETAVITKGRRLVRARRVRAASALSLLVAAGIALTPAFLPAQVGVPAGAPSVEQAEDAGGRQEAAWTVETTMDVISKVHVNDIAPPEEPPLKVKIVLGEDEPGHYAVSYEFYDTDGTWLGTAGSGMDAGKLSWSMGNALPDGLILGVIDDEVTSVTSLAGPDAPDSDKGVASDLRQMTKPDGTVATVFQMRFWTEAEAEAMDDFLWRSADGHFRTGWGHEVLQVDVPDAAEPQTLFFIPETSHLGYSKASTQVMREVSDTEIERGAAYISTTNESDAGRALNVRIGYLPAGSADIQAEFGEHEMDIRFVTIPAGTGHGVFWFTESSLPSTEDPAPPMTLTWVDASGENKSQSFP